MEVSSFNLGELAATGALHSRTLWQAPCRLEIEDARQLLTVSFVSASLSGTRGAIPSCSRIGT